MINFPSYVIHCGSTVPHSVCDECEVKMRMRDTHHMVKCPICRVTEETSGVRTPKSYEYELSKLYENDEDHWSLMASGLRTKSSEERERYILKYPKLRQYFQEPRTVISPTRAAAMNSMFPNLPPRQQIQEPVVRNRRVTPVSPVSVAWSSDSFPSTSSSTPTSSTESLPRISPSRESINRAEGRSKSIFCQGSCGMMTKTKCTLGCGRHVCESCCVCLFH